MWQVCYNGAKLERVFMRKPSLLLFFFFAVCAPLAAGHGASLNWHKDYGSALKVSKAEKRPLLLYFTASDWSGWCMKMKNEVLDAPEFIKEIGDAFVLVEVDLPRTIKLPKAVAAQNKALREKMGISDFPRVLLVNDKERVFLRAGYLPGGAKQYAKYLLNTLQKDKKITQVIETLDETSYTASELEEHYQTARELYREREALCLMEEGLKDDTSSFFAFEKYKHLSSTLGPDAAETLRFRKKLAASDPKNEKGIQFSLAMIEFQERSKVEDGCDHPHRAIAPLEEYLEKFGSTDPHNVWRLEMMISQYYLDRNECKTALDHAQLAQEVAPPERQEEIGESIGFMQSHLG